jgi:hypothetical protein
MLPAVARFAGPAIAKSLRALYPSLGAGSLRAASTWKPALGEIAIDVVPNLAFSALAATGLPGADPAIGFEGPSAGDRLGAAGADFLMSYPAGALGRLAGAGGASLVGRMRGRPLGVMAQQTAQGMTGMAAEMGLWGTGVLRNPVTEGVYGRYNEAAAAAAEQDQAAFQDHVIAQERARRAREEEAMTRGGLGAVLDPFGLGGYG